MISLPTSTDPVNATFLMSGCITMAFPAVGPYPGTMLTTPAGKPASLTSEHRYSAVNGVCSAGFITIVQPAASAGPHFQANISIG